MGGENSLCTESASRVLASPNPKALRDVFSATLDLAQHGRLIWPTYNIDDTAEAILALTQFEVIKLPKQYGHRRVVRGIERNHAFLET